MEGRVKCVICETIYNRTVNKWKDQMTTVTTTIICPYCGSDAYIRADLKWEEVNRKVYA